MLRSQCKEIAEGALPCGLAAPRTRLKGLGDCLWCTDDFSKPALLDAALEAVIAREKQSLAKQERRSASAEDAVKDTLAMGEDASAGDKTKILSPFDACVASFYSPVGFHLCADLGLDSHSPRPLVSSLLCLLGRHLQVHRR